MKKLIIYMTVLVMLLCGFFFLLKQGTKPGKNTFSTKEEMNIPQPAEMPVSEPGGYRLDYAVVPRDGNIDAESFDTCFAVLMVNTDENRVTTAKNAYRRIYPASTTKIMTAILVMDAINEGKLSTDDMITLEHDTDVGDPEAVASDLTAGCSISVRNLLHGLLIRSYNDYAVILAEKIGGSVEGFVRMMNEKAASLGMVGTQYVNPHGLHDEDHYTTAYDMYLLMQAAKEYPMIEQIDQNTSFTYTYLDANGEEVTDDISPTNYYLAGYADLPSNIKIQEWKTGTTTQAGHVLTMNCTIDGSHYTIYCADYEETEDLYYDYSLLFNRK